MYEKTDKFFKIKPFDHQLSIFNKIKDLPHFALFWEMGTGKTFELIHVLRYQMNKDPNHKPFLIICPKAVMHNWKKEFVMFSLNPAMDKLIAVLDGSKYERMAMLKDPTKKIFIINYEGVGRIKDLQAVMLSMKWGSIVCDEAQRIKNHRADQTKIILKLSKNAETRFIATGTPILNTMMDIYTLFLFLDGGALFGDNFFHFQNKYFMDKNAGWKGSPKYFPLWMPRKDKEAEVQSKIYQVADRKLKEDCLDLPPKLYEVLSVEMTTEQARIYKEVKEELISFFNGQAVVASTALTKILRLNQITSGFVATDAEAGDNIKDVSSTKLDVLEDTVRDLAPNKVIIWAFFRNDIKRIKERMAKYGAVTVFGGTSAQEREHAVKAFQNDPNCRVFIGQQRACGLGITLTAANYAIYYSQGFSSEDRQQSEDRCHRAGSERHSKITYIDLVCKGTIDEYILEALKNKKDLAEGILDRVQYFLQ